MRGLVIGVAILVGACTDAVAPAVARMEIDPPPVYRVFWQDVERCSTFSGAFGQVTWFVAFEIEAGSEIVGQRNSRHEITVRSDLWLDPNVVRHEILHELLAGDPSHRHPSWRECEIDVGLPVGMYPPY